MVGYLAFNKREFSMEFLPTKRPAMTRLALNVESTQPPVAEREREMTRS